MGSRPVKVFFIIGAFIFFLAALVFNFFQTYLIEGGLFTNTTGNNDERLDISPPPWAFSIWGVIYTWQALHLCYALSTFCRSRKNEPLYAMEYMPAGLYFIYMLNMIFNVSWLFLWDRGYKVFALVVISLLPFTLYVALYFSLSRLYRNLKSMTELNMRVDIWLTRLFTQNGLAFYATWTTIATLLNLGTVIAYVIGFDQTMTCTILLSIVSVEAVTWFLLDMILFDKYTRYLFSPYVMLVYAFISIVTENLDLENKQLNSIFMLAILAATSLFLLTKILVMFIRHIIDSPAQSSKYQTGRDITMVHVPIR